MKNILQYFEETCEQLSRSDIAVANESSSVTFNRFKNKKSAGRYYDCF